MELIQMKVIDFSNEVDSSSPAPGGGSVSALASNIGVSLSRMMCNLSFGKKKFEELDKEIKDEFNCRFLRLGEIRSRLMELVDEDTNSFNEVMKAFKLPKETQQEKTIRKEEIQKATILSIEVPLLTAILSLEALKLMSYFIEFGNQNAITDLGVGCLLVNSGLEGAVLNVKVNLGGIEDKDFAKVKYEECEKLISQGKSICDAALLKIHSKL